MLVNGHGEYIPGRLVDDTKTIALPGYNVLNRKWYCGTTLEAASTVNCSGV